MAAIDDDTRSILEGPNYVHLATLMPDGAPHSVAVWGGLEGDRVCFFTQPSSLKAHNVERDGRVAFSVTDHENPYRTAQLRGTVVETRDGQEALQIIDRLAHKYTGQDFPMRSGRVYLVQPTRVRYTELPFVHAPA
ncbi:MAG: class F420-dependent oxidoreductase [Solirubrobacterales bacterium]|jgi:PPOX class probable F420-dependent enzyme|nr:class F420-dependent oxidoreductase [Solirubrobacterales bacterium]